MFDSLLKNFFSERISIKSKIHFESYIKQVVSGNSNPKGKFLKQIT
jgi:hypothetical protein